LKVIDKAKAACTNAGETVADHFVEINRMVSIGSGSEREMRNIK
jgi:DNA-damage-inducible protein D